MSKDELKQKRIEAIKKVKEEFKKELINKLNRTKRTAKAVGITAILTAFSPFAHGKYQHTCQEDLSPQETSFDNSSQHTKSAKPLLETPELRTPERIYHRFEEIPEITDDEALFYSRNQYTYIINADRYQQEGILELKRVLADEVSDVTTMSLIYRREGGVISLKINENEATPYNINTTITSKDYVGPSQMSTDMATNLIIYSALNPQTREYAKDYLTPASQQKLDEYGKLLFNENGTLKSPVERAVAIRKGIFNNLKLNTSKKTKTNKTRTKVFNYFIDIAENMSRQGKKDLFIENIANCTTLFNVFVKNGEFNKITDNLALKAGLINSLGEPNSTRLPLYVIAAINCQTNSAGNPSRSMTACNNIHKVTPKTFMDYAKNISTGWAVQGLDEISQRNILTEKNMQDYVIFGLSGSSELYAAYKDLVDTKELKLDFKKNIIADKEALLSERPSRETINLTQIWQNNNSR